MQGDGVGGAEGLTCSKAVDPVLLAVVACVASAVAAAVPWLDADERCVLGRRRPDTNHRSVECEAEPRCAVCAMKGYLADLRVLKHDCIDGIKSLSGHRKESVLREFQRVLSLSVHTSLFHDTDALQAFRFVE